MTGAAFKHQGFTRKMTIKALPASFVAGALFAVMNRARALLLLPIGYLASRRVASQVARCHTESPQFR
jgi:hypothetical protein